MLRLPGGEGLADSKVSPRLSDEAGSCYISIVPLYEYECRSCFHRFEELVFGDAEPDSCPSCNAAEVEKQLSSFAIGRAAPRESAAACGPMGCGPMGGACGPTGGGCDPADCG